MMLGLGVGIDYALFILSRHRQNLAAGQSVPVAIGRANATAGLSVLFAGVTVIVAILGLKVSGIPMMEMMGYGSAIMVAVVMLASITLLPAMLGRRQAPREQCPDPVREAEAGLRPGRRVGAVGRARRRQAGSLRRRRRCGPRRCSRSRRSPCTWASPTPGTTRRRRRPARPTT